MNEGMRVPDDASKSRLYAEMAERLTRALAGEHDLVARMSTTVAVLHGAMPHFYWTGFYRVMGAELVIGPYQGTPACLRIPLGRGVCGTAWESGRTQIVADVASIPNHIVCDARSASEIVVPVAGPGGGVVAVLDIDSCLPAAFDATDGRWLEEIVGRVFGNGTPAG